MSMSRRHESHRRGPVRSARAVVLFRGLLMPVTTTPAVWKGRVYIGTRGGYLYVLGNKDLATSPTTAPTGATASSDTTYQSD